MKAVVLAYHNMGCLGIRSLLAHGFDIRAVFTHADDPGETIWFNSVAELAAASDIPVYAPEDINHPLWVERIKAMGAEILFSFYYRCLVGRQILELPAAGSWGRRPARPSRISGSRRSSRSAAAWVCL